MVCLQDQKGGEDDKPKNFSETSLGAVGIGKTRDVGACHEVLDITCLEYFNIIAGLRSRNGHKQWTFFEPLV